MKQKFWDPSGSWRRWARVAYRSISMALYAYADEPHVDEEWLKKYEKEEEEDKKLEEAVQARLV